MERILELDAMDVKLLGVLQRSCDGSLDEIGHQIGLSRNACWRRIRRLEEAGVIRGRVALVDPEAVGLTQQVFIAVRTNRHDPAWSRDFARAARAIPEVLGVYRMTGDLDYLIAARVRDISGYDALYQRLIAEVPLADVSASFVMEEIKHTTALPVR